MTDASCEHIEAGSAALRACLEEFADPVAGDVSLPDVMGFAREIVLDIYRAMTALPLEPLGSIPNLRMAIENRALDEDFDNQWYKD